MSASARVTMPLRRSRLLVEEIPRLGVAGLRARPTRAILSALGIAIGIAAMVAVLGVSSSSQARLNQQLDRLGTNLLTVTPGTEFGGGTSTLPADALLRAARIDGVEAVSSTASVSAPVYRSSLSDPQATNGIATLVADLELPSVVSAQLGTGVWLNPATASFPTVVLGRTAADRLGVVSVGSQILVGGVTFTVVGILEPVALAPELDAAALIGSAVASELFGFDGSPTTLYERSSDERVPEVRSLLPASVSPENPSGVEVSRPSDALAAKNAANETFTALLLGLGSVALLVGGIGVANTMIISVLERRREIGLRRALGATRGHIVAQFLTEALALAGLGGLLGAMLGILATGVLTVVNDWPFSLPPVVLALGCSSALVIGAVAGLYPAIRASRTSPTTALSS